MHATHVYHSMHTSRAFNTIGLCEAKGCLIAVASLRTCQVQRALFVHHKGQVTQGSDTDTHVTCLCQPCNRQWRPSRVLKEWSPHDSVWGHKGDDSPARDAH